MAKNSKVPDAWEDDDWEAKVDTAPRTADEADSQVPMTRAERQAKHAEDQRKLWESAEAIEAVTFLPTSSSKVPLTTPFKPALKVLSRKPAPKDGDIDEDEVKTQQPTPEEIRIRQQREREEKQRRYDEARAKIFGDTAPSSGQSSPGTVTPPQTSEGRQNNHKGKGRGRGGNGNSNNAQRNDNRQDNNNNNNNSQSRRAPNNPPPPGTRELFDPSYSPKPSGLNFQKRGGGGDASPQFGSRSITPREEDQIIRTPRGPDASGKGFGGFAAARRGTQEG
ncbi:hypothetical protein B0T17DRAFT_331124 [Bombardia bombarda]|uniref:SUZ domain-containing protein n=1 Tax=Bombardia bombarda TaxID=252184 RepID=A0AA39WMQ6_9PEZI|nr:hypothetical protein B0T17DRAFT_331124 [Bombardia bombarda]